MAVHTVKRSILTTLRKNRGLWIVYSRISCDFSNEETRALRPVLLECICLSSVYLPPSTYMQHNLTLSCIVKLIWVMDFLETLTDIRCVGRSFGNITIPAGQTKNRGKKCFYILVKVQSVSPFQQFIHFPIFHSILPPCVCDSKHSFSYWLYHLLSFRISLPGPQHAFLVPVHKAEWVSLCSWWGFSPPPPGEGTPDNGLYWEAPPERGTFWGLKYTKGRDFTSWCI